MGPTHPSYVQSNVKMTGLRTPTISTILRTTPISSTTIPIFSVMCLQTTWVTIATTWRKLPTIPAQRTWAVSVTVRPRQPLAVSTCHLWRQAQRCLLWAGMCHQLPFNPFLSLQSHPHTCPISLTRRHGHRCSTRSPTVTTLNGTKICPATSRVGFQSTMSPLEDLATPHRRTESWRLELW